MDVVRVLRGNVSVGGLAVSICVRALCGYERLGGYVSFGGLPVSMLVVSYIGM